MHRNGSNSDVVLVVAKNERDDRAEREFQSGWSVSDIVRMPK